MTIRTFTFPVVAPSPVNWVPTPGTFANVPQTNTFASLETVLSEGYDDNFPDTIDSWCATRRCPTLGQYGSILAFGGGHSNGMWNGIYRFDLGTRTWSTHQINCGLAQNGKRLYAVGGEFGEGVYGEFLADAAGTTTHVGEPCARHTYDTPQWLPQGSIGNDPLGYHYIPWGAALAGSGNQHSRGSFYAALSNPGARWTRFGLWASTGAFGSTLYDSLRNKVVGFPAVTSSRSNSIWFHQFPGGAMTSGLVQDVDASGLRNKDSAAFYWAARDLYIHIGGDAELLSQGIKLISPTVNGSNRYQSTRITTSPLFTRATQTGAWVWMEDWQQLIHMNLNYTGNATVHRFTPPADPITQAWTYQTTTLTGYGGTSLQLDTGTNHPSFYGRMMWFPEIGAFLSMAMGSTPPQVLNIPRY